MIGNKPQKEVAFGVCTSLLYSFLNLTIVLYTSYFSMDMMVAHHQYAPCDWPKASGPSSSISTVERICPIAKNITVEVISDEFIGSGILIRKDGFTHVVLTSAHVLSFEDPPYFIRTFDGNIYVAKPLDSSLGTMDLAFLYFDSSTEHYPIASIVPFSDFQAGDTVFASGFLRGEDSRLSPNEFVFREGEITAILDQPIENGYQIASNVQIDSGMSGGPLINSTGEIIGVNGLRDDPLWDIPIRYEDGTEPEMSLQSTINQSSLAIPLQDILTDLGIIQSEEW
ncbi:MAG: serine protease [Cyanobacteria bacterium P01_F01_bin.53]